MRYQSNFTLKTTISFHFKVEFHSIGLIHAVRHIHFLHISCNIMKTNAAPCPAVDISTQYVVSRTTEKEQRLNPLIPTLCKYVS